MKKFYSLIFTIVFGTLAFSQTFYSENMGTPSSTTVITSYTGFENASPITYSGSGDVRTSVASSGYSGASGGGNVWLSSSAGKYFQIDGLNTSAYTTDNLQLTFGYLTTSVSTQLVVEFSTNSGTTWTPITFTQNTNTSWNLVTIPGSIIPSSATLSLKFTQPATTGMRIDDVKLSNVSASCTLVIENPVAACSAFSDAIDTYTVTIPFTGGGNATYSIITSAGTVGGDNPTIVATGNIVISGISEGTVPVGTITGGTCNLSFTAISPECDPINALPYSESFPYTVGNPIGSEQKWTQINSGDDVVVSTGGLTYTGITNSGNSISFLGGGKEAFTPFTPVTTGTVYTSFLVNITSLSNVTVDGTQTYFASLTDDAKNYLARLFVKKTGTQYQIGFDSASSTTNYDATLRNENDVLYVVISYDFATNSLKAWLNPTLASFNESNPTLSNTPTVTAPATSFVNIGGFLLRQDNDTKTPAITFDELKVGLSLADLGVTLAINQNEIDGLTIYPNPVTNGILHIESSSNIERTIAMYDLLGKKVFESTTVSSSLVVSALKGGVYFVKITEAGKTATRKIVIK